MTKRLTKFIFKKLLQIGLLLIIASLASWVYNGVGNRRYLQRIYVDLADQYDIVAFGDSLIEGVGAAQSRGFITLLSESLEIDIYNAGVRRMQTHQAVDLVDDQVIKFQPKLVIISLGGNDALRNVPEETTRANLFMIVDQITSTEAHVVLLGVGDAFLGEDFQPTYDDLEKYFDTDITIVRDFYDPVLLKPKYLFDPLHPNDEGHKILADNLEPIIRNLLLEIEN